MDSLSQSSETSTGSSNVRYRPGAYHFTPGSIPRGKFGNMTAFWLRPDKWRAISDFQQYDCVGTPCTQIQHRKSRQFWRFASIGAGK